MRCLALSSALLDTEQLGPQARPAQQPTAVLTVLQAEQTREPARLKLEFELIASIRKGPAVLGTANLEALRTVMNVETHAASRRRIGKTRCCGRGHQADQAEQHDKAQAAAHDTPPPEGSRRGETSAGSGSSGASRRLTRPCASMDSRPSTNQRTACG